MKTRFTAAVAGIVLALGMALPLQPVHGHDYDNADRHHYVTFKACAKNAETINDWMTTRDNSFRVRFQYKYDWAWTDWGSDTSGDWKFHNGSQIVIDNNSQNRGKWWCMKDRREHKINHTRHGTSAAVSCGDCSARMEIKYGPDNHFDLLGYYYTNNNYKTVCVKGHYDALSSQWETDVWITVNDSC